MSWSLAGESADGGGGGCVDRDGSSGYVGVLLASRRQAACRGIKRKWICRQWRRQWVCLARAGESEAGGGGGWGDRGGGSGCVGVLLASWTNAAAVDPSTEVAAVGVLGVELASRTQPAAADPSTEAAAEGVFESCC